MDSDPNSTPADEPDEETATEPAVPSVTDEDIAESRAKADTSRTTKPDAEAALDTPPLVDERPNTARSMRSVTAFDLASQPEHRALSDSDIPEELWAPDKSIHLEDHAPDHDELRAPSGVDLEDALGPEMEDEPPKPRPRYVTQAAADLPTKTQITRRRVLRWSLVAGGIGVVGWQGWGRRPVPLTIGFKPAVLTSSEFGTLLHACEAVLGDPVAAVRAATLADQRSQWLGAASAARLSADLKVLEFGAGGLLDSRRFTRLPIAQAQELMQQWSVSPIVVRRRVAAEVDYIARWYWASHPDTRREFGLPADDGRSRG